MKPKTRISWNVSVYDDALAEYDRISGEGDTPEEALSVALETLTRLAAAGTERLAGVERMRYALGASTAGGTGEIEF